MRRPKHNLRPCGPPPRAKGAGRLRAAWETLLVLSVLGVVICCAPPAAAQSKSLHQLFEGIERGTATPQVKQTAALLPADDSEESIRLPQRPAARMAQHMAQADWPDAERPAANVPPTRSPAPPVGDLPPPAVSGTVPLSGWDAGGDVQLEQNEAGLITLVVRDASLSRVLAMLAETQGLNIVASNDLDALISITIRNVPLEEAMSAILSVANYTWVKQNNIILITSLTSAGLPAAVQGRQIQVFDLDFASAAAVSEAVRGFLSPIGSAYVSEVSSADNRRTREMIVVEDLPESLSRIAAYIHQVDQPPRQVLIEAHILQVTLDDTNRQGVNLDGLLRMANAELSLETKGLAAPTAPQAFLATLNGTDLTTVIEVLQTTTDTKSLGSPRLLVLNEQEARFQVGDQIGYLGGTTTTELMATQEVQFLDVGVVLTVRPRITRDCRVLLHVKPEVSTGQINPTTQAPDKSTTELETDVMLADGQGMVLGGLIKETDSVTQSKIPYLGDVRGLGWFFRKSEVKKQRAEIIVALLPRVQPYTPEWQAYEQGNLARTGVSLFEGPLCRTDRPWDIVLPDGRRVTKPLIPLPLRKFENGHVRHFGESTEYYVPPRPLPRQQGPAGYGPGYEYPPGCELPPGAGSYNPFLSDEIEPSPAVGGWGDSEIISDQE